MAAEVFMDKENVKGIAQSYQNNENPLFLNRNAKTEVQGSRFLQELWILDSHFYCLKR